MRRRILCSQSVPSRHGDACRTTRGGKKCSRFSASHTGGSCRRARRSPRSRQRAGLLNHRSSPACRAARQQDRHRRSARDDRLQRPPVADAASRRSARAARDAHRRFVDARPSRGR
jgi:hypothetical protein